MGWIEKIKNVKKVNYSSNLTLTSFKKKVELLLEQKELHFTGKLTNDHEFVVYDKFRVIGWNMPGLPRKSAYLKGQMIVEDEETKITLKVYPNAALPLFAIFALLSGSIILLAALSSADSDSSIIAFGVGLLALGMLYYPMSTFFRNRLQKRLVKHLELE